MTVQEDNEVSSTNERGIDDSVKLEEGVATMTTSNVGSTSINKSWTRGLRRTPEELKAKQTARQTVADHSQTSTPQSTIMVSPPIHTAGVVHAAPSAARDVETIVPPQGQQAAPELLVEATTVQPLNGKLLCGFAVLVLLLASAVAVTGILCSTGMCSNGSTEATEDVLPLVDGSSGAPITDLVVTTVPPEATEDVPPLVDGSSGAPGTDQVMTTVAPEATEDVPPLVDGSSGAPGTDQVMTTVVPEATEDVPPLVDGSAGAPGTDQVMTTVTPDTELDHLFLSSYSLEALQEKSSPQSKAVEWLVDSYGSSTLEQMPTWRKHQLFALATTYYSTEGEYWTQDDKEHWLDATMSECDWTPKNQCDLFTNFCVGVHYRIHCSPDSGQVTELDLSAFDGGLGGRLPRQIALLSSLEELVVFFSGLRGKLEDNFHPEFMALSNTIRKINFRNNLLSGTIPTQLGTFTQLRWLNLNSANNLSGTIPTELGLLTRLLELSLGSNNLSGTLPESVCQLGLGTVNVDEDKVVCPPGCSCS